MSLDQGDFFFSYYWDLSTLMQTQIPALSQANQNKQSLEIKDSKNLLINLEDRKISLNYIDRFIWNTHILQPLLKATNNSGLIIPIINGSVTQKNIEVEGRIVSLIIISRRSRFYAGPRYLKRGINVFGDVANEVETEQVLFENNPFDNTFYRISSFLHVKNLICYFLKVFFSIEAQFRFFGDMKIYIRLSLRLWFLMRLILLLKRLINISTI